MRRANSTQHPPGIAALLARAGRLLEGGRAEQARQPLYEAAAAAPGDAGIRHDLGYVCLQAGRLAEAAAAFQAALDINPRFTLASFRLGIARQTQGEEAEALVLYRRATELQPSLVEARYQAGALLETLGRSAEAVAAFRRGAATTPRTSLTRLCNARALVAEGRDAEAERALRQLLALDPNALSGAELLGIVLSNAGRFEEAFGLFERAATGAPQLAGCYYELARCRRLTEADTALLGRMQDALASPAIQPEARLKLHLALGKAADDLGDPGAAMRHYGAADAWRSTLCRFDAAGFAARIDRLIAHFTPELVARAAGSGHADATPILIIGLPRSGTTLVEQILSCHPQVAAGGELPFWTGRGACWERAVGTSDEAPLVAAAASDYAALLRSIAPAAARVTDKMPLNLFWAGLIHTALPRATIICCKRSPIDTALSIHRTYFNPHTAMPTGGEALVAMVEAAGRLAAHWRAVLPPDRYHELEFEQLVETPEPAIRRLLAACGLPWADACLRPERNPRPVRTPSKWQVRQPISADTAGSWRRYEPWLGALAPLKPAADPGARSDPVR